MYRFLLSCLVAVLFVGMLSPTCPVQANDNANDNANSVVESAGEVKQDQDEDALKDGEFKSIFDGETLKGWQGLDGFWSVTDQAITGKTTEEKPLNSNTFLFWEGGKLENFELQLKFRLTSGNSGIQYRSQDLGNNVVGGYQADMDFGKQWIGILYDERGRGVLAARMQSVVIQEDGEKKITALDSNEATFLEKYDPLAWNSYHIIANGNELTHIVNGTTTIKLKDMQVKDAETSGILALQLHTGPPMTVQFKDIKLKVLKK